MRYLLLSALIICGCKNEKNSDEPPPLGSLDGEDSCGGTAPEIVDVYCENTGMVLENDLGIELPTLTIYAQVVDDDGDLTSYNMLVEFDDVADGELSEDAPDPFSLSGSIDGESCTIGEATLGAQLKLQGGAPSYSTSYEWHVSIFDEAGDRSDTAMVVCTTPNENGEGTP